MSVMLLALMITVAVALSPLGMVIPALLVEHRWSRAAWSQAAAELGLHRSESQRLVGKIEGWPVEVSMGGPGKNQVLRIRVSGAPIGFALQAQNALRGLLSGHVTVTGDVAFDRITAARVPASELGLLGPTARATFLECSALGDPVVRDGVVELLVLGSPYRADMLVRQVYSAVALVAALQHTGGPVRELSVLARTDPVPEVRARMLGALAEVSRAAAEAVALDVRYDPHPSPRLAAAQILGDGREALAIGTDRRADLNLRLEALSVLWADPDSLALALRRLGDDDGAGLRAAALAARRRPTEAVRAALAARCRTLAARSRAVLFRGAAVGALEVAARTRDPELADAAAVFLQTGEDQLRVLTIRVLGAAGTVRSVPALQVTASRAGPLSRLRPAAEAAIRAIQGRTTGTRGALALATGPGGLSLADAVRGAISPVHEAEPNVR